MEWWLKATAAALDLDETGGVRLLGEGQLETAVLVEPDLVVRIPRHEVGVEHLRQERRVLAVVAGAPDVSLPTPIAADLTLPPTGSFAVQACRWHPPQQPLPQGVIGAAEERLELVDGDGSRAIGLLAPHPLLAALQTRCW